MSHNLFWSWEECTKFHEKSAYFCTLWENSIVKTNQICLILLSKRNLYCGYSNYFDKDRILKAYTISIFSALFHCIKLWADYNSSFLFQLTTDICSFVLYVLIYKSLSNKMAMKMTLWEDHIYRVSLFRVYPFWLNMSEEGRQ